MNKQYDRMLKIIDDLSPLNGGELVDLRLALLLPDGDPCYLQGLGWHGHVYQAYLVNEFKDHHMARRVSFVYRRVNVRQPGEWVCIQTDMAIRQPGQSVRDITEWKAYMREVAHGIESLWECSNWELGMPIWRSYASGMHPFLLP
jgi:hypothetical protein